MKGYENVTRNYLVRRVPVIIRIDGKAFHTFTKGFRKPYDYVLIYCMWETAKYLCEHIQGCKIAYIQSDEISLLLTDYDNIDTCAWFDNNIQKIVSVSASMATLAFNKAFSLIVGGLKDNTEALIDPNDANILNQYLNLAYDVYKERLMTAVFDSRAFNIPKEEVVNYFIWRQQDAIRNSIQMAGRAIFSHKELNNKSCEDIKKMLLLDGINWDDYATYKKRGTCIVKEQYNLDNLDQTLKTRWVVDKNIPLFTEDKNYIQKYI